MIGNGYDDFNNVEPAMPLSPDNMSDFEDDGFEDDFERDGFEGNEDFEAWKDEIAIEAGMLGGCSAYNEARGFEVEEVEPCGHHCDYSCPRCGGE